MIVNDILKWKSCCIIDGSKWTCHISCLTMRSSFIHFCFQMHMSYWFGTAVGDLLFKGFTITSTSGRHTDRCHHFLKTVVTITNKNVRFSAWNGMNIRKVMNTVFLDVMPCSLSRYYWHFEEKGCLYFQNTIIRWWYGCRESEFQNGDPEQI